MLNKFKPDITVDSTYNIDFDALYAEGIRGIIFDIDNTLVAHDAPCNDKSDELLRSLYAKGFKLFIISNNEKERCEIFIPNVKVDYISKGGKPKKDSYLKAFERMELNSHEVVAIGDQLFTDVWGGNRLNLFTILVRPIDKNEEFFVRLKRYLEKFVFFLSRRH